MDNGLKEIGGGSLGLFLAPTLFHRGGALDLAISLTYLLAHSLTKKFALAL